MGKKCSKIPLSKRDVNTQTHTAFCVGCKKWDCEDCAKTNVKRFMARVINGILTLGEGNNWYLWTLTVSTRDRGFEPSIKAFREGYRKLYYELKNEQKRQKWGDIHLIKVFEKHKDGTLHIHIISNLNLQSSKDSKVKGGYVFRDEYKVTRRNKSTGRNEEYYRSAWLEDKCKKSGLGYICECRPLKAHDGKSHFLVAGYVAKYLSKSDLASYPKYFHRVEFSQNFPQLEKTLSGVVSFFSVKQWNVDTENDWHMVDKMPPNRLEELIAEYLSWQIKNEK